MENSFGFLVTLLLGLFAIIKHKDLGKFMYKQAQGTPLLIPKKWYILNMQILFLVVGIIFFTVSLLKLFNNL